ncbi:thioredoxin family protein [Arenibaculum pallidiluteum]|uniref:thioredoxin family protein n=1 Tax=Arenibaculum pallidiluteum TaxID=2812559 RepID=UPI001A974B50|nr:thioredoxin family protein [Arenibaculum pallidiluteum]
MADSAVPDFFERFPMRRVDSAGLDGTLAEPIDGPGADQGRAGPGAEPLSILFLWGRNCPNCDIAKRAILAAADRFRWPGVRWLHDNVYEDFDMATRFGLHGIPAFLLFRGRKPLGRIVSWPGADEFAGAVERQIAAAGGAP